MIRTHKKTRQRLLLKRGNSQVSTLFLLDKNGDKIQYGFNTNLEPYYKVVVCLNKNLIWEQ